MKTKESSSGKGAWRRFWLPVLAGTLFGVAIWRIFIGPPRPYVHPHFFAASYVAPAGCDIKEYKKFDDIPIYCADEKYIFDDWKKYGLDTPGRIGYYDGHKSGTYYRVGNDLVGFRCGFGNCNVSYIEKNVFTVR